MAAATNQGFATGRLAKDPVVFTTESGAKHVLMTLMVDRNYVNATSGERDSDAIPVEAWVNADRQDLGVYEFLTKGALVSVSYAGRSRTYADKQTGEVKYAFSLLVEDLRLLESKATMQERRIRQLQAQAGARQAVPEPAGA